MEKANIRFKCIGGLPKSTGRRRQIASKFSDVEEIALVERKKPIECRLKPGFPKRHSSLAVTGVA